MHLFFEFKLQLSLTFTLLYRMATKQAKPDGQFWLPPELAMHHMGPLPVQVRRVSRYGSLASSERGTAREGGSLLLVMVSVRKHYR